MKSLNEWARENNYTIDTLINNMNSMDNWTSNEPETLYDEELIQKQVNDWIYKLIGLCSAVPKEDRSELTEQIIKAVRHHLS